MGHELANSFLLFRVHKCFLKMIKNLSWRHRLHFFVSIVMWFTIPEYYLLQVKGCVGMFEGSPHVWTVLSRFFCLHVRRMSSGFCTICWSKLLVQYMILLLSQSLQSLVKLRLVLGNFLKGRIPVFSGSCMSLMVVHIVL